MINNRISRKAFIVGCGLFAGTFLVGGIGALQKEAGAAVLRPPSGQDEKRFYATCIKCQRCISVCPQGSIRTGLIEDGLLNYRTPIMDFHRGICDFCEECVKVCPTSALTKADAEETSIGVAVVDKERCIAWLQASCRMCADECEYEAIIFDDSGRPFVDDDACNGCGVCENVCPSNSYRTFSGGTKRGINVERRVTDE